MTDINDFKVGDHVWFYMTWGRLTSGTIQEFQTVNRPNRDPEQYAKIYSDDGSTTGALLYNIWRTKEEATAILQNRSDALVKKYKESIRDVEDLVRFMYNKVVASAEEYTNWEARTAARERAHELLDIDLDK